MSLPQRPHHPPTVATVVNKFRTLQVVSDFCSRVHVSSTGKLSETDHSAEKVQRDEMKSTRSMASDVTAVTNGRIRELNEKLARTSMELLSERRRRLNTEQLLKFAEKNCSAARAELSKRKLQSDELLEERTQLASQVKRLKADCNNERMKNAHVVSINGELQQQCLHWKMSNLRLLETATQLRDELRVAHELLKCADTIHSDTTNDSLPHATQSLHRFGVTNATIIQPVSPSSVVSDDMITTF